MTAVSGLFAHYPEGLMKATTATNFDITSASVYIAVQLYTDDTVTTDDIDQTVLDDETITTVTLLNSATTDGQVEAATHTEFLASKTVGTVAARVFDAADTVMGTDGSNPAVSTEAKSLIIVKRENGTADTIAGADIPLAHFALTTPVIPNGQAITITWSSSGIWKLG